MDVYSFGIMLIEMCSGKYHDYFSAYTVKQVFYGLNVNYTGELFDDYEELIHAHVEEWPAMLSLVRQCIHHVPQRRPNMSEVNRQLEIIG